MLSFSKIKRYLGIDYISNDPNYFVQNQYTKLGLLTERVLLYNDTEGFVINPHPAPTGQVYDFMKVIRNFPFEILDKKATEFDDFLKVEEDVLTLAHEYCESKQKIDTIKKKFMVHKEWFIIETTHDVTIDNKLITKAYDISYNIKNKFPEYFLDDYTPNVYVKGELFNEKFEGYIDFVINHTIFDLKVTSDPNLKKVIYRNRYDIQLAIYYMLYREMYPDVVMQLPFILIVCSDAPEHSMLYRLTMDDIRKALYGFEDHEGLHHLVQKKRFFDEFPTKRFSERHNKVHDLNLLK